MEVIATQSSLGFTQAFGAPDGIRVDLSGEYAVLLIPSDGEKGTNDRSYPVTPDFEEFLLSVPKSQREGFVFNPELYRGICRRIDTVSKAIAGLCESAGVKVDQEGEKVAYASAHDLRRAFGFRWARRVIPMVLKELMRPASVTTTEKFYVDINAQSTAKFLREVTLEVTPTKNESQREAETRKNALFFIEGAGTRTLDLRIKSPLLYQLSYAFVAENLSRETTCFTTYHADIRVLRQSTDSEFSEGGNHIRIFRGVYTRTDFEPKKSTKSIGFPADLCDSGEPSRCVFAADHLQY